MSSAEIDSTITPSDGESGASSAAQDAVSAGHQAASKAGRQVRSFSSYLEGRKLEDLLRDAQRLAQKNPALMVGGGIALGFVLSRFLRASAGAARRQ